MKNLFTAFFMAWGMFCALPRPVRRWDEALRSRMLACFPLVGALTGAIWAVAAVLLRLVNCPMLLSAAILTALPFLLTGFIHLDGYMDCCDAILSRRDRAERLRILKDPHVGSFAVICFGLLLLLEFACMYEVITLDANPWALAAISCAARCPSVLAILTMKPLPGSSYARSGRSVSSCVAAAVILALAAILPLVFLGFPRGLAPAVAAVGAALAVAYAARDLGGMSGDISGFAVTLGELCGAAALALL